MTYEERYQEDCTAVEAALAVSLAAPDDLLQKKVLDAMRYSLLGGGKRVRAVLALETCAALGGNRRDAIPAACALEMAHAYSLIHDDLPCMDDDDLRRGKPSCHVAFGEAAAVLAGDGLQTLAFETLSNEDTVQRLGAEKALLLVRCLAQAIGEYGMLGGQSIDVEYEGCPLTPAQHRAMAAMKTGALLTAAAETGCICAGQKDAISAVRRFGAAIGEAFQVVDDILDVTGDAAALGKPVGSDAAEQKNTFVTMLGLSGAREKAELLCEEALSALSVLCPDNDFLPELVRRLSKRTF